MATKRKVEWRFRTYAEVIMDPKTKWLLEAYLPEDSLIMLYGAPNTFKSFIALDWALSVATGRDWLGARATTRRVVYVSAEGQRGIRQRAGAWLEHNGLEMSALDKLAFITQPVAVPSPAEFARFLAALATWVGGERLGSERGGLGLIIFDTVARCFGGLDENSTRDMSLFVKACDLLRFWFPAVTVLLVHHSGKDETLGARGSIALHGATDGIFQTASRRGKTVLLKNPRSKDSDELRPLPLQMLEIGESLVVTRGDPSAAAADVNERRHGVAEEKANELLPCLCEAGRLTFSAWFHASNVQNERTFQRYVKRLLTNGRVTKNGDLYTLKSTPPQQTHQPGV